MNRRLEFREWEVWEEETGGIRCRPSTPASFSPAQKLASLLPGPAPETGDAAR